MKGCKYLSATQLSQFPYPCLCPHSYRGTLTLVAFVRHPKSYYEKDKTRTRVFYHLFQWLRSDLMLIVSIEHTSIDLDRKGNVGLGNLPSVTDKHANTRLQARGFVVQLGGRYHMRRPCTKPP